MLYKKIIDVFGENHAKHVTHYVGEIQELVALKKWYVHLPLESTDLRLCTHTETVGTSTIKSGKFKAPKISVNKNYSLASISELKNYEFTNY